MDLRQDHEHQSEPVGQTVDGDVYSPERCQQRGEGGDQRLVGQAVDGEPARDDNGCNGHEMLGTGSEAGLAQARRVPAHVPVGAWVEGCIEQEHAQQ